MGSTPKRRRRRGGFRWRKHLPLVLLLGAVACLVVAFSGFRLNREVTKGTVVLAMDVSHSMEQKDVDPDRLVAAQAAAKAFLQQLPPDFRVGLVTFAGEAKTVTTPTNERDEVAGSLGGLSTAQGTVIGDGLTAALDAIGADWQENGKGPAAVLLLSDGQDTGSVVSPDQAAQRAKDLGVPVFTVTIGQVTAASDGGGADADLLQAMADTTGAKSFTAQTSGQLADVYSTLGSRLSYDLAISDTSTPFVILGTLLAIGAAITVLLAARSDY